MTHGGFTFVNSTGNPISKDRQGDDLPTIRSHAMREVRRLRDIASSKPKLKSTDRMRYYIDIQAFRNQDVCCCRAFANPYYGTAIQWKSLPGDVLPWLEYFLHGFKPLTFPISVVRPACDIFGIAMTEGNPALLHALCALSAIHRALESSYMGSGPSGEMGRSFLYHKQRAITLLQENLSKPSDPHIKSSLATVALLLIIESLSGDSRTAKTHRSGFLELVKQWKGNPESAHLLVSDVLASEIKSGLSSDSEPLIELAEEFSTGLEMLKHAQFVPHRPALLKLGSAFMDPELGQCLDPEFVLLMCAMRNLINAFEKNFDLGIGVSNVDGTHFLAIEHKLLSFRSGNNIKGAFYSLTECCRIGALLYYNVYLWHWPKKSTLIAIMLGHLRAAMSQWTPNPRIRAHLCIRLWLYFVGSVACADLDARQWYIGGMKDVLQHLHITCENDFRAALSTTFFVDRMMGKHLKDCYNAVLSETLARQNE